MSESLLGRLGTLPPHLLGGMYVAIVLGAELVGRVGPGALIIAGVVELSAFATLTAVVAWHRDDDIVEAGVLLALITGVAFGVAQVLNTILDTRSLAGLLLFPGLVVGLLVRAVLGGTIGAPFVWLLRFIRRPRRTRSA